MKTILFTGAKSGIISHVIDVLVKQDYFIYLTVHNQKQLELVQKKYHTYSNVCCFCLDITKESERKKLKRLDIDILVNNAAIGEGGSIAEIPMKKVRNNFDVNVFSSFEIVQLVLKQMMRKKKGKIIMMSSLAGIMPLPFLGVYSATKASIITLATTLRWELASLHSPIQICLIEPGMYHTGFNQVMLENKYDWMEKGSYFSQELELIRRRESWMTAILEHYDLNSIVKKIVKAIETDHPKFLYRAPISQVIGAKLYQIFFS